MAVLVLSCHPSGGTSLALSPLSAPLAARLSRIPRCKLAKRSLVAAADRTGAGVTVSPAVPGIRFAFGTRRGRPASVVPPELGTTAASAAFQPSSACEVQVLTGWRSAEPPGTSMVGRPRRNQSDSTASKIGSLFSSPSDAAGGTITPPFVDPRPESWLRKLPLDPRKLLTGAPSTTCACSPCMLGVGWVL